MMWRFPFHATVGTTVLLVAAAVAAEAQEPHMRPRTTAVQELEPDGAASQAANFRIRELRCRGKEGIDLRVHQDPSPRNPRLVTMQLRYEPVKETRSFSREGMGLVDHGMSRTVVPGSCSWNVGGFSDVPPEPGVVYFDLPRDAQLHGPRSARDTTIGAAVRFPDIASLTRYLSDPGRYWVFYVNDMTDLSHSFGAWPRSGQQPQHTPAVSSARTPPPSSVARSRVDAGAQTVRAPTTTITNVRTTPGPRGVRVTFNTRSGTVLRPTAHIRVQFGVERPSWNEADRQWRYPAGGGSPWYGDVRMLPTGVFEGEPIGSLTAGRVYHYLITVQSSDPSSPPDTHTGSFTAAIGQ